MPLFQCTKCGCIENTALAGPGYWTEMLNASREKREGKPTCAECATGKWHGEFKKESAKGWFLCSDGFIYSKVELEHEVKRFAQQKIKVIREIT